MSDRLRKPVEVAVALQGGGALGAYEWGALDALLELMDELEDEGCPIALKAVSGVSIGRAGTPSDSGCTSTEFTAARASICG